MLNHIEEAYLVQALGHTNALDVVHPTTHQKILSKGTLIDSKVIGQLAALGFEKISVFRKPRVSIILIGDRKASSAYDFCRAALQAELEAMRIHPVMIKQVRREPTILRKVVPFAMTQSDILIFVVNEIGQSLGWVRKLMEHLSRQKSKPVFCLPSDPEKILGQFKYSIQPAILLFMGLIQ